MGTGSCVPEVEVPDQNKIYLSLNLKYNKTLDKTSATAAFLQDNSTGAKLELDSDASVTFNDNNLIFDVVEKCYGKDFIGLVEDDFTYIDLDNDQLVNSLQMIDTLYFETASDTQSISNELILDISTPPLEEGEQLEVDLINIGADFSTTLYSTTFSGNLMNITTDQLADVPLGQIIIVVRRLKYEDQLTQSKLAGGEQFISYEVQDTIILN
jgi:hypothetical protein